MAQAKYESIGSMTLLMAQAVDYPNMAYCTSKTICGDELNGYKEETYKVGNASAYVTITKNYSGPKVAFGAEASVFACNTGKGAKKAIEQVDAKFFSAKSGVASSNTYVGVNASANLMDANVSIFNAKLGVGVSSGVGIDDDSASVKLAGCGVTVGRKIGISVLDCEIGVDFGKLFN